MLLRFNLLSIYFHTFIHLFYSLNTVLESFPCSHHDSNVRLITTVHEDLINDVRWSRELTVIIHEDRIEHNINKFNFNLPHFISPCIFSFISFQIGILMAWNSFSKNISPCACCHLMTSLESTMYALIVMQMRHYCT